MEKTVRSASVLDVDLVWFFRDAEAAMGVRASSVERLGDTGLPETTLSERVVKATTRYRAIASVLEALPRDTRRSLMVIHAPPPPALKRASWRFGETLPYAVLVTPGLYELVVASWDDEQKPGKRAARRVAKACLDARRPILDIIRLYRDAADNAGLAQMLEAA